MVVLGLYVCRAVISGGGSSTFAIFFFLSFLPSLVYHGGRVCRCCVIQSVCRGLEKMCFDSFCRARSVVSLSMLIDRSPVHTTRFPRGGCRRIVEHKYSANIR